MLAILVDIEKIGLLNLSYYTVAQVGRAKANPHTLRHGRGTFKSWENILLRYIESSILYEYNT